MGKDGVQDPVAVSSLVRARVGWRSCRWRFAQNMGAQDLAALVVDHDLTMPSVWSSPDPLPDTLKGELADAHGTAPLARFFR